MVTTLKHLWSEPTTGLLTIGTGNPGNSPIESVGSLNLTGFDSVDQMLAYANQRSTKLLILPGLYPPVTAPVTLRDGTEIVGTPGATLQPLASGSTGIFTGAGQFSIEGLRFLASTFVANQALIRGTSGSKDPTVRRCTFQMDTSPASTAGVTRPTLLGDEANPMKCIEFASALRPVVERCIFLPNYAITCIKATEGAGHSFWFNHFANDVDAGLGSKNPGGSQTSLSFPRPMYRGIHGEHLEWGACGENRAWGLGDNNGFAPLWGATNDAVTVAAGNISHTILKTAIAPNTLFVTVVHDNGTGVMQDNGLGALTFVSGVSAAITTATINYTTGALVVDLTVRTILSATESHGFYTRVNAVYHMNSNNAIGVDEGHHSRIIGGSIESVACKAGIRLQGVNSYTIANILIGYLNAGPSALGEAGIVILGKDGTDAANPCASINIHGVDVHNNGAPGTLGCGLYAKDVAELLVTGSRFAVQTALYSIILDSGCVGPAIMANGFDTLASGPQAYAILLQDVVFSKGVLTAPNKWTNFTSGLVNDLGAVSNPSAAGKRKILDGIQDKSTGNAPLLGASAANLTTNVHLDQ